MLYNFQEVNKPLRRRSIRLGSEYYSQPLINSILEPTGMTHLAMNEVIHKHLTQNLLWPCTPIIGELWGHRFSTKAT